MDENELFERYAKRASEASAREGFKQGLEVGRAQGYGKGFADGVQTGELIGFAAGVDSVKSALSDGTRHGSSECARALESLKRIGALPDDAQGATDSGEDAPEDCDLGYYDSFETVFDDV